MSKRNQISYVKPQDPSFLAKLKAQIGYSEGPTTDTKRQKLQDCSDSGSGGEEDNEERPEREDEQPQIVVLRSGDLSAEQVVQEQARLEQEAATAPADLNQPIVFQKRKKSKDTSVTSSSTTIVSEEKSATCAKPAQKEKKSRKNKKPQQSHSKLSFGNFDDDEVEAELEANQ